MNKDGIKITVKLGDVLDSGYWGEFCIKYGINEWCLNEGLAERETEVEISLRDAEFFGLISKEDSND